MSTITGLFGGGGGGGAMTNIFTDPTYMMRSFTYSSQLYIKSTNANTQSSDSSTAFFTYAGYSPEFYTATLTAANTYVTVADISSTNGGFLYNVI